MTRTKKSRFSGSFKKIGIVVGGVVLATQGAFAEFTAPDMSGTLTDMETAFGAVLVLVVSFLGYKYIRKMFG